MKAVNILLLVLILMFFGAGFADPAVWKEAEWLMVIPAGVILVPGMFLWARFARKPSWGRFNPRILAAGYNGVAALLLGVHGVRISVVDAHPVAFAITEKAGSLTLALVAALNTWTLLAQEAKGAPAQRLSWSLVAGTLGLIIGIGGLLNAPMFFLIPSMAGDTQELFGEMDASPEHFFETEEQRQAMRRVETFAWLSPFCIVAGILSLFASIVYLLGAIRLLQQRDNAPRQFERGIFCMMAVSAIIAIAALASSVPWLRMEIPFALGSLVVNGALLFVVRRRGHEPRGAAAAG